MRELGVILWLACCLAGPAWAFDAFTVKEIKVEGLQAIAEGTVFSYLPISVGDQVDEARGVDALGVLYRTGFFADIQLLRQDETLIVRVKERPTVAKLSVSGNKDIETQQLNDAMKQLGLAEGRIYNPSLLDKVERELQRQYFGRGKYGVRIKSNVTTLERNRVEVTIDVTEGEAAKIRSITLVGNRHFTEDKLIDQFQLSEPALFSFFTSADQYSKQKLAADLETLRSYYLDRGFINFGIDSTQVAISPDKRDIFVTINVTEGDAYTVSEIKLAGDLKVPESELRALISIAPGEIFSRRAITESTSKISERLGVEGYAFANINTAPEINREKKEVSLTFMIDPGRRVYVRRINIAGNARTNDEVIRREIRQLEGALLSTEKISRSRVRLQRLGLFDEVNIETPAVPNSPDQVDVNVSVTEASFGSLMASAGFAPGQGIILSASVNYNNFLGEGKRISTEINNSRATTVYSFSYTNPYYTDNGVSRTLKAFYRSTDARKISNVATYIADIYGVGANYLIPLSEHDSLRAGADYQHSAYTATEETPTSYKNFLTNYGSQFDIFTLTLGWQYDSRDRAIFATEGLSQTIDGEFSVPGSGYEYYKLSTRTQWHYPLGKRWTFMLRGEIGFGEGYGSQERQNLPFFESFFAGGPGSVRGYEPNSLGPVEGDKTIGGALKVLAGTELTMPADWFGENNKTFRLSLFVDAGNVYPALEAFETGDIRLTYGLGAMWMSPIGPLTFSYAKPLNKQVGDQFQSFQFSIGTFF